MLVEADSFAWALPIAVVLLPAILAVFYGLAAALARLVWTDDIGRIAALAASFALLEWLRTFLFTGFPWNPVGYAAMPTPLLMQSVSVVGMVGMNALAVFVFAMPALLAGYRNVRVGLALALLLVAAHVGFGYYRLGLPDVQPVRSLPVRIVQPAIDQAAKLDRTFARRDFPHPAQPVGRAARCRSAQAEADHLAGDLAAVPADGPARRAGGDRRAVCPTARSCSPATSAPRARARTPSAITTRSSR